MNMLNETKNSTFVLTETACTTGLTNGYLVTNKDIPSLLAFNIPLIQLRNNESIEFEFFPKVSVYLLRPVNNVYKDIKLYNIVDYFSVDKLTNNVLNDLTNEDKENIKSFLLHISI